jgi:hypothetical protein
MIHANVTNPYAILAKREVLNLHALHWEVLRFVFEESTMSLSDIKLMQLSILRWKNHAETTQDDDILYMLRMMSKILVDNENGLWDYKKKTFKENNIDWRKVYDMPGARTEKDCFLAEQSLAEWEKKNFELRTIKNE